MSYAYGKAISYTLYAVQETDFVSLASVTTAPAIYVYKDTARPSREDGAAGTDNGGLVGTAIVSWAASSDGNGKTFTIPAISDPDPNSTINERTYWLAINFYLQDSAQKQTIVRALPMRRIDAHHKAVGTSASDLEAVYANIDTYASSGAQTSAITAATTAAKIYLESMGFEWAEIWRPDLLNTAICYKALSLIMIGNVAETGDRWELLSRTYDGVYKTTIDGLKLEFVAQPDSSPKDQEPVNVRTFFTRCVR